MKLSQLTIKEACDLLQSKEVTSEEITRDVLDRIEAHDASIRAYIHVDTETSLKAAQEADRSGSGRGSSPLRGIPLGIKDILCTRGMKTTCGSYSLHNFVPGYDATAVGKLRADQAVIAGKTNLDEFAMGSSNENSAFAVTRNPWNTDFVPGGSSGGSAAAVAADFCLGAMGTDTGGSIRQPASHCSVVGLKPTYGRVSRYGLVSYASSLDQAGPITKTVEDAAIIMNSIAGKDSADSTSADVPVPDFTSAMRTFEKQGLKGMKAGVPAEYMDVEGLDPEVARIFEQSKKVLEELGVEIVEVSLPHTEYAVAAYYIIAPSEASSNLARFDGVRYGHRSEKKGDLIDMYKNTKSEGFGAEVQRRIIMGTYALSSGYYDEYYGRAAKIRSLIMKDFEQAFESCDIILSPVAPAPAFRIGENIDDPLTMYLTDIFTIPANMAGVPGISVPAGFSKEGLPVGFQMTARRFDELNLLRAGFGFEQSLSLQKPMMHGIKTTHET